MLLIWRVCVCVRVLLLFVLVFRLAFFLRHRCWLLHCLRVRLHLLARSHDGPFARFVLLYLPLR